jgi:hypothetical protein
MLSFALVACGISAYSMSVIYVRVLYWFYEHPYVQYFVHVLFNSLTSAIYTTAIHISGLSAGRYWDD